MENPLNPRIETIPDKKLVGVRTTMSLSHNKTGELWRSFMLRRGEIRNQVGIDRFSLQVYPSDYYLHFNPDTEFEKWAAIEVNSFDSIPESMDGFSLKGGLYAVFLHRGAGPTARKTLEYIFGTWLPHSKFTLDDRPHFELLGKKYKNDDPDSEEEIWIPVKPR